MRQSSTTSDKNLYLVSTTPITSLPCCQDGTSSNGQCLQTKRDLKDANQDCNSADQMERCQSAGLLAQQPENIFEFFSEIFSCCPTSSPCCPAGQFDTDNVPEMKSF